MTERQPSPRRLTARTFGALAVGTLALTMSAVATSPAAGSALGSTVNSSTVLTSQHSSRNLALPIGQQIGTLRIPRFGPEWAKSIAEGTDENTVLAANVGHYPGTAMPGGDGNMAIAGHRTSYDAPFLDISKLVIGDEIVVETAEGIYLYRYRSTEYVKPTAVDVLNAVPRGSIEPGGKYITLTACNPLRSTAERIIAYGVFESFTPR